MALRDPLGVGVPVFKSDFDATTEMNKLGALRIKTAEAQSKAKRDNQDSSMETLQKAADITTKLRTDQLNLIQPMVDKFTQDATKELINSNFEFNPAQQLKYNSQIAYIKGLAAISNAQQDSFAKREGYISDNQSKIDNEGTTRNTQILLNPKDFLDKTPETDPMYKQVKDDFAASNNDVWSFRDKFFPKYAPVMKEKPFDINQMVKSIKMGDIIDGSSIPAGVTINDVVQKNYTPQQRAALLNKIMQSVGNTYDANTETQASADKAYDNLPASEKSKYKDADNPARAWVIKTGSEQLLNQKNVSNINKDYAIASSSLLGQGATTNSSLTPQNKTFNVVVGDNTYSVNGEKSVSFGDFPEMTFNTYRSYDAGSGEMVNKQVGNRKGKITDITTLDVGGSKLPVAVISILGKEGKITETDYVDLSDVKQQVISYIQQKKKDKTLSKQEAQSISNAYPDLKGIIEEEQTTPVGSTPYKATSTQKSR